ncbi:MAG: hypothetical protein JWO02_1141 [Solirubrobacterales bacterium]|nr:hypothetical protein [Solirubrobacterales bacterium]
MSDLIVQTRAGAVRGKQVRDLRFWASIPFAAPPVGDLRLRAPQPPIPWSGTRDATSYGPQAPQKAMGPVRLTPPMSEDCLTLNVTAPALPSASLRPVMVWIHGGGYTIGTSRQTFFRGDSLVRRGELLMVSFNYRLGALGYFDFSAWGADTNLGLRDQVAALAWVRDNIEAFGGDPSCVTLAGQSAGGKIVTTLLGMPRARGLFHRAVIQSPGTPNPFETREAQVVTEAFLEQLNPATRKDIATAAAAELVAAVRPVVQAMTMSPFGAPLGPVLDGAVLSVATLDCLRAGASKDVPVLTGTTTHELHLMLKALGMEAAGDEAVMGFAQLLPAPLSDLVTRAYSNAAMTGNAHPAPPAPLEFLMNDRMVRMNSVRVLEAQASADAPSFSYLLQYETADGDGAPHCIDTPLLFGTTSVPDVPALVGEGDSVDAMGQAMRHRWAAFMRTGDPNAPGLPFWPQYTRDRRATYLLALEPAALEDPWGAQRAAWDGVDVPGAPVLG